MGWWFLGGVWIEFMLCRFIMFMYSVCGIGVVERVSVFIVFLLLVMVSLLFIILGRLCSCCNFFFWFMLKWCFLFMIIRLRFLNLMLFESRWWVLIRMFIWFVFSLVRILCVCLLVVKCESFFICIGRFLKCFINVVVCCLVSSVVGISIVICLLCLIIWCVVCRVILVLLKFMLLEIRWLVGVGFFRLCMVFLSVVIWFLVSLNLKFFLICLFYLGCGLKVLLGVICWVVYCISSLVVIFLVFLWVFFLVLV